MFITKEAKGFAMKYGEFIITSKGLIGIVVFQLFGFCLCRKLKD